MVIFREEFIYRKLSEKREHLQRIVHIQISLKRVFFKFLSMSRDRKLTSIAAILLCFFLSLARTDFFFSLAFVPLVVHIRLIARWLKSNRYLSISRDGFYNYS